MNINEPTNGNSSSNDSVITLMRRVQQGELDPKNLGTDDRRRCVEHLTGEGYSATEISEILKVSERTIYRDRDEIRCANALHRDPAFVDEMAGLLFAHADLAVGQIRRTIRERGVTPKDRIDGNRACWQIQNQLVERLQSLGYLPTAATEVRGEFTHQFEALPSSEQMVDELARIRQIATDRDFIAGNEVQKKFLGEITAMEQQANKLVLVEQVDQLEQIVKEKTEAPDDQTN